MSPRELGIGGLAEILIVFCALYSKMCMKLPILISTVTSLPY